jgi:glucuronate isomerase
MKAFLDENFLLSNKTAQLLFHSYARDMPILDYHCHLPAAQIASDHRFKTITEIWLQGDHYKWRAMRANGVDESFITGDRPDEEKFQKWADTVPYTLRNPLYHWTHLELQRYFGVNAVLNSGSARQIFDHCNEQLNEPAYSTRNLLRKMKVQVVCTTDDPTDDLEHHHRLKTEGFEVAVLPAFRPDAAMDIDDPGIFNQYLRKLEKASGRTIGSFHAFCDALESRHDFFAANGCTVSDHGLEQLYAEPYSDSEMKAVFKKLVGGKHPDKTEKRKFKSGMLLLFAQWDFAKGWVQQFHLGAIRNNNSRLLQKIGPNSGWDSVGDFSQARSLSAFLNRLDNGNQLAKTIVYNLNPADNEVMATMIGNFNDGSVAGKIQWGSAWWFLDQKDGMLKQINTLSNMGLLSRFIGMLTDSRSFLSYPRHEYFRRILCNLFGEDIENGELPQDIPWTGKLIQDICFYNAKHYFNW